MTHRPVLVEIRMPSVAETAMDNQHLRVEQLFSETVFQFSLSHHSISAHLFAKGYECYVCMTHSTASTKRVRHNDENSFYTVANPKKEGGER